MSNARLIVTDDGFYPVQDGRISREGGRALRQRERDLRLAAQLRENTEPAPLVGPKVAAANELDMEAQA